MNNIIFLFVIIPIVGFILSLFIDEKHETEIAWTAFISVGSVFIGGLIFIIFWILSGSNLLTTNGLVLYQTPHYKFIVEFMFDKITAVFMLVGSMLSLLVTIYCRYYMHRENGFKRFFNTILFFFIGYNVTVLSGNFETLFSGWEVLGISSFLLIAFYRHRYLPVKNAIKVYSIYRIGDVGLLLAMWMSHHFWHANISFSQLFNAQEVLDHLHTHSLIGVFISLSILLSAVAKSAQFPFSSWLPRAMEGPTPSSAIFYGSLAVHIGVFLLLRTSPFWVNQFSVRILIGLVGLVSMILSTGIARVQSSVKSQIAYASIAQIGIIFIELAFGFDNLALFHFAGNAFLRTYQLLVSPSVVTYLIREQFYNFSPRAKSIERFFPQKMQYTLYVLSIKEWNLDSMMYNYLWNPIKYFGKKLDFLNLKMLITIFVPTYIFGLVIYFYRNLMPFEVEQIFPSLFLIIALIMVLKSFTERKHARLAWALVVLNHLWVVLAISFNEKFSINEIITYLSGVTLFGIIGYACLAYLKKVEKVVNMERFHGHNYEHPRVGLVFLLSCLGVTGFPITPTFIGEDLIYSHITEHQLLLAFLVSFIFILNGLAIIRIFGRVYLGPHLKHYHEIAYRSS